MTSISVRPGMSVPADASRRTGGVRSVMSPWAWLTVTCLLLGTSGGIRFWREWKFSALAVEGAACPFPLSELPRTMGTWQATDDSEVQLDPEVARFAGASEHIVRNYLDRKTGDQASALVLYGMADTVYLHTPEVCYPAAGYQLHKGPVDGSLEVPGLDKPVRYRWAVYVKRVGRLSQYEEVYYTFLHNGEWLPDVSDRWKTFRYHPGIFKIQFAHTLTSLIGPGEGPCPSLVTEFVRQIQERRTASGGGKSATAPTAGR